MVTNKSTEVFIENITDNSTKQWSYTIHIDKKDEGKLFLRRKITKKVKFVELYNKDYYTSFGVNSIINILINSYKHPLAIGQFMAIKGINKYSSMEEFYSIVKDNLVITPKVIEHLIKYINNEIT